MHVEIGSLFVNEKSEEYLWLQDAWQLCLQYGAAPTKRSELERTHKQALFKSKEMWIFTLVTYIPIIVILLWH